MFKDRYDAGRRLAKELVMRGLHLSHPVVIALPKGGVPVAYFVAQELNALLDFISLKKIGLPGYSELALGAVTEDGVSIYNEGLAKSHGLSLSDCEKLKGLAQLKAKKLSMRLSPNRCQKDLTYRDVIIVDDGIATGATVRTAIKSLRQKGVSRVILATPVSSSRAWKEISKEVDIGVVLEKPRGFSSVGRVYQNFNQVSFDEAIDFFRKSYNFEQQTPEQLG